MSGGSSTAEFVIKYKYVHIYYLQHVYDETGIQVKQEDRRIVGESELFDREDAANAAVVKAIHQSGTSSGANMRQGRRYTETTNTYRHRWQDTKTGIWYRVLEVNRWEIREVRVQAVQE